MHILINKYLQYVNLHLDIVEDDDNCMRILIITGAAMNIGNMSQNIQIMSECLEKVEKFLQYGMNTDHNILQFLAVLDIDTTQQLVNHEHMTDFIQYHTPQFISKREFLIIYFASSNDVSFRCS